MTPSKYQQEIYDWIQSGKGGGRVSAVAGSGKTTTLVNASEYISGTALFCAFNKHVERELSSRLLNIACKTIHGIGMGALYRHIGKVTVEGDKYKKICASVGDVLAKKMRRKRLSLDEDAITTAGKAKRTIMNLSRMAMLTLTNVEDHEALKKMASMYSIRVPKCQREDFFNLVPQIIEEGEKQTRDGVISFDDMVYYPAVKDLNCKQHLWVMVDEAQDLSAAQLAIVMNSLKGRGRLVAVGDPLQSIYGFAGADPWSFNNIGAHAETDLPLSICYRCSNSIVDLASNIVPQIEPREDAPDGKVESIWREDMFDKVQSGDMILCRINSPIVSVVIDLITDGRKAYMRGNDIMQTFLDIVNMVISSPGYSWDRFGTILMTLREEMRIRLTIEDEEGAATVIADMYDSVGECAKKLKCKNDRDLVDKIQMLFRESPDSILCSSIHRAKGLEADNVFIVHPHRLRLSWKEQKEWQKFQEQCCEYVAITRAKNNLYMVREPEEADYKVGQIVELPDRK